jgi:hypothetical protein
VPDFRVTQFPAMRCVTFGLDARDEAGPAPAEVRGMF